MVHGLLGTRLQRRRWVVGFICIYSHSPSPTWLPKPRPLSGQRQPWILRAQRSPTPAINCACKGFRRNTPYENLIPDDMSPYYGELYDYFNIYHSVITTEIKPTIHVTRLNHPETTTLPSIEKLVFHETSPWCQKGWGPFSLLWLARNTI